MLQTRSRLLDYMSLHMRWADEYTLTWADGRWIVYVRWEDNEEFGIVTSRQVEGWPFFKHLMIKGSMDAKVFRSFPAYSPKVRILDYDTIYNKDKR